jgi:sucrose-6F-phosphate phosphohydrolase
MSDMQQPVDWPPVVTSTVSKIAKDFLIAEYTALRAEIVKRCEIQHQLIAVALVAIGTLITVSYQSSSTMTLAYPILAIFLAAAWAQNDFRVRQIGSYIKNRIEKRLLENDLGWEHAGPSTRVGGWGSLTLLASRGVFVGTEILAVALGLFKITSAKIPLSTGDVLLLIVDVAAIILTFFLLRRLTLHFEQPLFQPTNPDKPFLLAADIDGTLIGDEEGELSLKTFVRDHSESILLAVITGRSLSSVKKLVRKKLLPHPDYIVSSVGTELFDYRDKKNVLGQRYAEQVSKEWDLEILYKLGEGKGISRQKFVEGQPRYQAGFNWDGQSGTLAAFRRRLAKQPGCHILPSSGKYIDVLPSHMGKGEAVQFIQQKLGIEQTRVIVAGDSGNDKEMFETNFKGVIPANALEELKAFCLPRHYQSSLPAARGVLDGLFHFGFIKRV